MSKENVKVAVRCRPLSKDEIREQHLCIVEVQESAGTLFVRNPKSDISEPPKNFTFDHVFGPTSIQENVYVATACPIVQSVLEGYNGTIFAYGQTGTGKTFTMAGETDPYELRGITPRAFEQIFYGVEQASATQYLIRASYLEIYNEQIRDLLAKNPKNKLDLKEHPDSGVYVKDLTSMVVKQVEEMKEVMRLGARNRSVGETEMNQESSRSHSIFIITVESSDTDAEGIAHYRAGKLNLVDLAGSERQSKTGSTGDRFKEATNINKSLLALGNVISSLVDGQSSHVPYRDSKLTRLLQESLGGNSKTVMIANLGPADWNYDETISTLRYANRAKNIKCKPKINEDPKDALLREYQEEIARLKAQLEMRGGGGSVTIDPRTGAPMPRREVIEKTVYVHDQEQIRLKEEALAKEAEDFRRKTEQQKKAVEAQKNLAEDEKRRLLEELSKKEERQRKSKEKQQKLLKKLKAMEDQINQGNSIIDQATRQEQELQMAKLQLDEKRRQETRLAQELRAQEEEWTSLEQRYNSRQEHVEDLNKKLKKLWMKVQGADTEVRDIQQEFQREKEDMLDTIRYLNQQIKLRSVIIESFVPLEEVARVEKYAVWNEEEDEYVMPPPEKVHLMNQIKRQGSAVGLKKPTSEYARIARGLGENSTRFKHEDILTLDLDLPDRTTEDYNRVVTDTLRDIILSTLNDIEDDMSFVSIESYRGEDSLKKSRPSTAKRPGTAARKKAAEAAVEPPKPSEASFPKSRGLVKPK
mmetsp:Transcript_34136/g.59579  ORF Transcript_34136/g.59579 Transcript_34136/m.59579 type:complete len:756 (+) Transcript_34136:21-2288(+)